MRQVSGAQESPLPPGKLPRPPLIAAAADATAGVGPSLFEPRPASPGGRFATILFSGRLLPDRFGVEGFRVRTVVEILISVLHHRSPHQNHIHQLFLTLGSFAAARALVTQSQFPRETRQMRPPQLATGAPRRLCGSFPGSFRR
jgi:hypothetical protein